MVIRSAVLAALAVVLSTGPARAQTVTATVAAGAGPESVVVNPITNLIYVANSTANTVTVIDGATNAATTVAVGTDPISVAVNPLTNQIYVANYGSANVTVINGATNATTTVAAGTNPIAVAVNPVTNQIYVANWGSANVTVINGANNTVAATVAVGTNPTSVAVNPVTNQIYVANYGSANVTAINGANNSTATVAAGSGPSSVAVNPVTNQIYVANYNSASVTVINGANNSTATVATGSFPCSVAVNPVTNQIYVADDGSTGSVTVINGANNSTANVTVGSYPHSVAVDSVTNQIYVANNGSANVTIINGASNNTATLAAGSYPQSVTVNPVTNKIYTGNYGSANVTVIDGATNASATVAAGKYPDSVAVNPVTNQIYVANASDNTVTVINGATNSTTTVAVGTYPASVAVNPVTNQIYVANENSNNVTVIDGPTNNTTTIAAGTQPVSVAVNPVTNRIYVVNYNYNPNGNPGSVTVIDGASNNTTTVAVGIYPKFVALNPLTNKIYVANFGSIGGTVTLIDGATNNTITVGVGNNPFSVAVNPVTNKIYVPSYEGGPAAPGTVTVIDGATNGTTAVAVGSYPLWAAVNPVTNKIYVANEGGTLTVIDGATNATTTLETGEATPNSGTPLAVNPITNKIYALGTNVLVIDGATNSISTVAAGTTPSSVAVNPATNQIYVANSGSNNVTVIAEEQVEPLPLTTSITPLTDNQTDTLTPSFTFTANSVTVTVPDGLYLQVDTRQNAWTLAAGSNPTYSGTLASLQPGYHILYAFAGDGQEATSTQAGSPLTGAIQAYGFLVVPATTAVEVTVGASPAGPSFTVDGTSYNAAQTFSWTPGSSHAIATSSPQTGTGAQYTFAGWSDGNSALSRTVTAPYSPVSYIAEFNAQYLLTTAASPAADGTVTAGGYYAANTAVPVTATAHSGFSFVNWTGAVASATSASTTVTMSAPETITANFVVPLAQTITFGAITAQTVGTSLTLNATASSGLTVSFSSLTASVCTVSGTTASLIAVGACSIQATQPGNGYYAAAMPVTQTFPVLSAAAYNGYDTSTQGNWIGNYGADGYLIANEAANPPAYATVSLTGDGQFTWVASTSDPRALQTPGATGRIASTYYSSSSFKINVNLTDGNSHRVALYLLDWDSTVRAETISVLDAATNTVLNSETFSGFHNGQYVSWNLQGNVIIQLTKTGGSNAVAAGIFFDYPFYPSASATYSGADTTTQGAWTGFYGADGQLIANDAASAAPAYASVKVTGDGLWTWSNSTTDSRALQTTAGSATLIASAYYSASSFTIDVNLTDGQLHQIALYLVDWDGTSRSETISVLDAATSKVLDSETFSSFHSGQYAPWSVQGHVLIQVTRTGGVNAVVSGIFFDPPSSAAAFYCCYDTQTQGTWTGAYGTSGYQIANEAPDLPAYASVRLKGGAQYTWAASTTDVRALQTASGSSNRIASAYYSGTTFTIDVNLRDGRYHGIELYLLDWDSTSRAETISILDAESNTVLDTETYSSFHNGEWADWDVRGHVLIQVTRTGGANAVVSGIFID